MASFDLQPTLETEEYIILPVSLHDFEQLYEVASDPEIWEQHPNKDRWKRDVFKVFFEGAIQSRGAFKIVDKVSQKIIGSTRIYDYNSNDCSILMGYTFYAKRYWGTGVNHKVKSFFFDYLFQYVNTVILHIGASNIRSQISIQRLSAEKIGEIEVAYYGEGIKQNFIYQIDKKNWEKKADFLKKPTF
jgi:RimJ/RimL family protein N-acetyltransferase